MCSQARKQKKNYRQNSKKVRKLGQKTKNIVIDAFDTLDSESHGYNFKNSGEDKILSIIKNIARFKNY